MDNFNDIYIQKLLKNWAAQYRPPSNSKRRLLWLAAHPRIQLQFQSKPFQGFSTRSVDWSILIFQHLMAPGLQTGLPTSRHLIW